MPRKRCRECGADLRLRPGPCPLCGTGPEDDEQLASPKEVSRYQADIRKLRAELKRLREEAQAS